MKCKSPIKLFTALLIALTPFTAHAAPYACRAVSAIPWGDTAMNQHMNAVAEKYIILSFQIGQYDKDYVDFYFGPEKLKQKGLQETKPLPEIEKTAHLLITELNGIPSAPTPATPLQPLRHENLLRLLNSMIARVQFLQGNKMTFDQESLALYDAVSPTVPEGAFDALLHQLDKELPGPGALQERLSQYLDQFNIPSSKLDKVFRTAIAECRKRTAAHIPLPEKENFIIEYVKGVSWGAYNWFKGDSVSVIQLNSELPVQIHQALNLASHEGYPGHHVFYSLIEQKFYREKKWLEYSLYPLFSPLSLVAEGAANLAIRIVFSPEERLAFEKEVLFPLAGLNPQNAEKYTRIVHIVKQLSFAANDTGRRYLDGLITSEQAASELIKYRLMNPASARRYITFMEQYRSYIINYNVGEQLVEQYLKKKWGKASNPEKRWAVFLELMSQPLMPGRLK